MKIWELYKRFDVSPGLQAHMVRVAQFADILATCWTGGPLDRQFIVKCALVHDLGNIVKFTDYFGADAFDKGHWEQVKHDVIAKYGADDHEVTRRMLEEVNAEPIIIRTVLDKSSANAPAIAASDNWPLKILLYADLRIGPDGVITIQERLAELAARSAAHRNRPQVDQAIYEVEQQLQQYVSRDLQSISEDDFALNREAALDTRL